MMAAQEGLWNSEMRDHVVRDSDHRITTGRDDMIRFVLNNKADLGKGDKNGRNALIWAAVGGKLSSGSLG